jgi:hypothetical protein
VVYTCLAFSQPAILHGVQEQQQSAVRKQVAEGKITQAQADQATAMAGRFMTPTAMAIFGSGAAIFGAWAAFF